MEDCRYQLCSKDVSNAVDGITARRAGYGYAGSLLGAPAAAN